MTINPSDYEKPGTFHLGREYDISTKTAEDKLVLYDSKDLVTHGVVPGMTGTRLEEIRQAAGTADIPLKSSPVRALKKNISILSTGLAWLPYRTDADGSLQPAWKE